MENYKPRHAKNDFDLMEETNIDNMNYIILYADDYDYDVWKQYCYVCGVSNNSTYIKIKFKDKDVETNND